MSANLGNKMLVKDLIEILSQFDKEAVIVVPAYDYNGYNEVSLIEKINVASHKSPNSYGAGKYDTALPNDQVVLAIVIQ